MGAREIKALSIGRVSRATRLRRIPTTRRFGNNL
jgi:hypothetical protein